MSVILKTVDLCRTFKTGANVVKALDGVNININQGELTIIRGRSGSGKTTLMNILGTLDEPTSGDVFFEDRDIIHLSDAGRNQIRRKDFSFIFQSVALMPHMTAYENVEFALRLAKMSARDERVEECLEIVEMLKRSKHMPSEMSGGEQQRVAIARAVAHRPKIIFADEPTAQVDTHLAKRIMKMFRTLIEKENVTIVMTTHDLSILELADHVYTMEDGKVIDEAFPRKEAAL